MHKTLKFLFISGILLTIGMELLCHWGTKCKNCGMTSENKENSIKDGFYLSEYIPNIKNIKLKHHDLEVDLLNAWAEKEWFLKSDICFIMHNAYKDTVNGKYNLIFPVKESRRGKGIYWMKPIINGKQCTDCRGRTTNNSKQIKVPNLPDTVEIQIYEKKPNAGPTSSKDRLPGKRIVYIKK